MNAIVEPKNIVKLSEFNSDLEQLARNNALFKSGRLGYDLTTQNCFWREKEYNKIENN